MTPPPASVTAKLIVATLLFIVAWIPFLRIIGVAGLIVSIIACVQWSQSKGLSPWFGILGVLPTPVTGWIILFFIPGPSPSRI